MRNLFQQLGSSSSSGIRRVLALIVLIAGIAFLGFVAWVTRDVSKSNDWSEIVHIVGPVVAWALLAIATACAAVLADRSERRHAVDVAAASSVASGTVASGPVVVSTRAWRGSALAGLAILAFSLSLVSSTRLGHLRSITDFALRGKPNVEQCVARTCSKPEAQKCATASCPTANVAPCEAELWAPSTAAPDDRVAIDLSVYCPNAPPQQMPTVTASYGDTATKVITSFAQAKTLRPNERVWRWFVTFPSGEQPLDVRVVFLDDPMLVPLGRINVSHPTTLAGLQEYTTSLGGLLGAVIGLFGTLGSLFKGWRGQSSTIVGPGPG
ncbi:MAG: hypothetical protein JWM87_22 [Candidatus Eremiobacteraeota bacterium]|nr:hypothetical protein [Candidatus Eremiobacteraeota bacterium]